MNKVQEVAVTSDAKGFAWNAFKERFVDDAEGVGASSVVVETEVDATWYSKRDEDADDLGSVGVVSCSNISNAKFEPVGVLS